MGISKDGDSIDLKGRLFREGKGSEYRREVGKITMKSEKAIMNHTIKYLPYICTHTYYTQFCV